MDLGEQIRQISIILQEIGSELYIQAFRIQGIRALSMGQFRYLEMVVKNPGITPSGLAGIFQVQKPTATQIVNILVKRGLVDKRPSQADQRVTLLYPTDITMAIIALRASMFPKFAARIKKILSKEQYTEYEKLNEIIIKNY